MKQFFLVITEEFATTNNGYKRLNCIFNSGVTLDGHHVVSVNALNEFPELFDGLELQIVQLTPADFPQPEFPINSNG